MEGNVKTNKELLIIARDFISTLEEKEFCRLDQSNEVGQHCVFGHLFVNDKSPFYKKDDVRLSYGRKYTKAVLSSENERLSQLLIPDDENCHYYNEYLPLINNLAPENKIKDTCIDWFNTRINELD